jgi:hypothetical protein
MCVDAWERALIEAHDALFNVQHRRNLSVDELHGRSPARPRTIVDICGSSTLAPTP